MNDSIYEFDENGVLTNQSETTYQYDNNGDGIVDQTDTTLLTYNASFFLLSQKSKHLKPTMIMMGVLSITLCISMNTTKVQGRFPRCTGKLILMEMVSSTNLVLNSIKIVSRSIT